MHVMACDRARRVQVGVCGMRARGAPSQLPRSTTLATLALMSITMALLRDLEVHLRLDVSRSHCRRAQPERCASVCGYHHGRVRRAHRSSSASAKTMSEASHLRQSGDGGAERGRSGHSAKLPSSRGHGGRRVQSAREGCWHACMGGGRRHTLVTCRAQIRLLFSCFTPPAMLGRQDLEAGSRSSVTLKAWESIREENELQISQSGAITGHQWQVLSGLGHLVQARSCAVQVREKAEHAKGQRMLRGQLTRR